MGALRHLNLPSEPNGFYGYNALQQLACFSVFFVFGLVAILSGIAMSPAVVNRFPAYPRLFGGRQSARSIHFLTMAGFLGFLVVHVTLVVMTGFARNMNHIVIGTDETSFGITGSRSAGSSNTRWSSRWPISGSSYSWNTPRCITASRGGPASLGGAECRCRR